ncbi:MAG: hypothetical protein J3K34DRAFT_458309 [Monoraphidium minutum]|nr:MAG: hypothetical protein J3K34DRAFT_458309 [Monoraphidium minutum]
MARTGTVWGAVWRAAAAPLSRAAVSRDSVTIVTRARARAATGCEDRFPLVYPRYIYQWYRYQRGRYKIPLVYLTACIQPSPGIIYHRYGHTRDLGIKYHLLFLRRGRGATRGGAAEQAAAAAALLRARAEARVASLAPAHALGDRFDAIDAAVEEVGESRPLVGPLLRLVAELYRRGHQEPPPPRAAPRRPRVRWVDGGGATCRSSRCAREAPGDAHAGGGGGGGSVRGSTLGTTISPCTTDDEAAAAADAEDESEFGSGGGSSCGSSDWEGGGATQRSATGGGGGGGAAASARRRTLVSDRFRGSSFARPHHASGVGASAAAAVAAAGEQVPGEGRPAAAGAPASDADAGEGGTSCSGASSGHAPSGDGRGRRRQGVGGCGGRRPTVERYSWGRSLTTDKWVAAPAAVGRLDLSDLEGRIREARQKRFAAFREERARLAAAAAAQDGR